MTTKTKTPAAATAATKTPAASPVKGKTPTTTFTPTAPAPTTPAPSVVISNASSVLNIPADQIEIPLKWNARIGYKKAEMSALVTSIKRDGLLQPVVVRPNKGGPRPYVLVAGFRRILAYCGPTADGYLAKTEIPAHVLNDAVTELDARYANLAENVARDNLTSYSIAIRCADLQGSFGESGNKIADRLGLSKSYVNNLIKCVNGLAAPVLERWAQEVGDADMPEGGSKVRACTTDFLNKIVRMSADEQIAAMNAALGITAPAKESAGEGEGGEGEGGEGGNAGGAVAGPRRATVKAMEILKEQAKTDLKVIKDKTSAPAMYLKGVINALEMAQGVRPSIHGIKVAEKATDKSN